ncbi:MAG: pyridoxamine 5'-phosphate oxidase family protein [Nitrososphaerales archaeon]
MLRLAVIQDDNFPHVTPVWFVFDGNAFYIATDLYRKTGRTTKKVEYIKKNDKVALLIDSYNPVDWDQVQGVMIQGIAEFVQDNSDEYRYAINLLKKKYPDYRGKYSKWLEGKDPKRHPIVIKVAKFKYTYWPQEGS